MLNCINTESVFCLFIVSVIPQYTLIFKKRKHFVHVFTIRSKRARIFRQLYERVFFSLV